MTHEETIKRIQKLVPSVLELEFGCEVLYGSDFGSAEQKVTLGNPYAVKDGKVFNPWNRDDTDDLLEILGKPITLAVVMMAFGKAKIDVGVSVSFRNDGELAHIFPQGASLKPEPIKNTHISVDTRGGNWNLSKDNFNDQSEETQSFIGGLLD